MSKLISIIYAELNNTVLSFLVGTVIGWIISKLKTRKRLNLSL